MEHSDKLMWELARRRLEKTVQDRAALESIKLFSLTGIEGDTAFFVYGGAGDPEAYREMLEDSISWAAGRDVRIKIQQVQQSQRKKSGRKKKGRGGAVKTVLKAVLSILLLAAVVLFAVRILQGNSSFEKGFYSIASNKINGNIRIVQLSDLGDTSYGSDNSELKESVALLNPDIIVLSGNMTGGDRERTISLCREFNELAEVYYVFGAAEAGLDAGYRETLEASGVHVLADEAASVSVDGSTVDLYGIGPQDTSVQMVQERETFQAFQEQDPMNFKVVISSTPYLYSDAFFENSPDLLLAGGTLGGGINLPYFGVLHEERYGFLPEWKRNSFIYGRYYINTTPLIVSRGLAREGVLRFNNRPELVIVDISRY